MSDRAPKVDPGPDYPPDLLALQRRTAAHGLNIRLPSLNPDWELPEPVDLGGISVSEMVVRLRRGNPQCCLMDSPACVRAKAHRLKGAVPSQGKAEGGFSRCNGIRKERDEQRSTQG